MTDAVLCPGSRNAPLSFALRRRRAGQAAHPDRRAHRRPSSPSAWPGPRAGRSRWSRPRAPRRPTCTRPSSRPPTPAYPSSRSPPTDPPASAAPAPTRPPTRSRLFGDAASFADLDRPDPRRPRRRLAPRRPGPPQLPVRRAAGPRARIVPTRIGPLRPGVSRVRSLGLSVVRGRRAADPTPLALGPRTVVVAGDDAGPPARALAEQANWPLLAEPSSGSRTGENPIRTYRLLLGTDLGARIERVVVFGHPTLSRPVQRLLARDGRRGRLGPRARPLARPALAGRRRARRRHRRRRRPRLAGGVARGRPGPRAGGSTRSSPSSPASRRTTWRRSSTPPTRPADCSFVGASNPIRDLDLMATAHPVGERRMVLANRGLAGIDGTVSSAIGAALGRPRSTRAIALRRRRDLPARRDRPGRSGPTSRAPT